MPEHSQDVPLLLLCAEDSEVALVQLVDALNRSGRAPEVVSGIEDDPTMLSSATDRVQGPALFVLCQTPELDRSQVLQLQGLFSARKGPRHRLIVVELDETQPLEALPDIEEGLLDALRAGVGGGPLAERVPKREIVRVSTERSSPSHPDDEETEEIDVVPLLEAAHRDGRGDAEAAEDSRAREEAEALARAFHEEMVAAEAVLDRRPRPDEEPSRAEPASAESSAEEGDAEELGPLSSSLAGVAVAPPLTAIQTDLTPTDTRPRRVDPEESDTSSPTARLEDSESRRGWWLAAIGAAALGGVALFVSQGTPSPRSASAVAASASNGTPASTRAPSGRARPGRAAVPEPEALAKPEAPAEAEAPAQPEPEAPAQPEPEAPAQPEPEAPAQLEPEDAEPSSAAAVTPSSSVPPAPVDAEALRIQEAIRTGKVQALDTLLVARAGEDVTDWTHARTTCRRKKIEGVDGWRLPSRWQLKRLDRAKMLDEGTYWSRERGPHDDDAYALDTRSGAMNVYLHIEPAAKVQCVRKR